MKSTYVLFFLFFISLSLSGQSIPSETTSFVLGEVQEIESVQLSEKRILNIYLPDAYKTSDTTRFPVIYLLDGSANEDFIHVCGLVQFFTMMEQMKPVIVVGISNVDRRRDFTFPTSIETDKKDFPTTGGSKKFIGFIEHELQPFVDKQYRTTSSRTLIGQSFGGLLATEILTKKPTLFNEYIIVSPSLWWDNESLLTIQPQPIKTKTQLQTSVYVAVGKEGKIMESDTQKLVENLKSRKNENIKVYFEYFPDENHATILHYALYKAFNTLKNKKRE